MCYAPASAEYHPRAPWNEPEFKGHYCPECGADVDPDEMEMDGSYYICPDCEYQSTLEELEVFDEE